eukprot:XP_003966033.1 PREDICTED: C-C chemokine receptor type 2-like [Takifugu rubripes]
MSEASFEDYYNGDNFMLCNETAVRPFGKVFLPTLYSLVFIVGFAGNSLVLCVLMKHWNQANLTDISLFNLALSDLLFVLTLPFYAHYAVAGEWPFGDFMCRFTSVFHRTGFFSSIFFMIFMTLDRYVVIMHALTVARYRTLRTGVIVSIVVWLLSFIVSLPSLIFTQVTNSSYGTGCRYMPDNDIWEDYNLFAMNIFGLVLPLLIMIACYARIIPRLVNMRSTKRHRVIRLIICIVLAFFLFWTPYNIYLFLFFLNNKGKLGGEVCKVEENLKLTGTVTETFAYTHCCLNPVIYAFIGEKFIKRVLNLLKSWFPSLRSVLARDLSENSRRKSSVMSQSSEVTSTFIS